jgi:hypothetical protein
MFVEDVLNDFGRDVTAGARANLKRKDKNASGELSKSLDYDLIVHKQSFSLDFEWEDYGKFIDEGVHGVGGTKADGSKWKKKRVFGSSFRYKSKRPPHIAFNGWTIRRGIAPRSKGGQFQKRKGLLFAIANSVYHTGLETTHFFTSAFDKEFKKLPDEVIKAYDLDLDNFLKQTLND